MKLGWGIVIIYAGRMARKQGIGKVTEVFNWIAQEDILALARDEAVQAGENARLQLELLELEEADEEFVRETMRRRLARTLVQLGMKIDPLAGEDAA